MSDGSRHIMKDEFAKHIGAAVVVLLGLLVLDRLPGRMEKSQSFRHFVRLLGEMHNGDLNADEVHALAAGYYEGLEDTVRIAPGSENDDYRIRDDFLRHEF